MEALRAFLLSNNQGRYSMEFRCPNCKKTLKNAELGDKKVAKFFPFCSQRCKMLDFGAWLDQDYRIETTEDDLDLDMPDNI